MSNPDMPEMWAVKIMNDHDDGWHWALLHTNEKNHETATQFFPADHVKALVDVLREIHWTVEIGPNVRYIGRGGKTYNTTISPRQHGLIRKALTRLTDNKGSGDNG